MSSKKPTMEDFFAKFDEAFFACVDEGRESSLTVSIGNRTVEIRIYEAGKHRVDFDEMILKAAKDAKIMNKGGI